MGAQDGYRKKSDAGNKLQLEYEDWDKNGIKIAKDPAVDQQLPGQRQREYNKIPEKREKHAQREAEQRYKIEG